MFTLGRVMIQIMNKVDLAQKTQQYEIFHLFFKRQEHFQSLVLLQIRKGTFIHKGLSSEMKY